MVIQLKKFGTTLVSRQTGREALLAFQPTLKCIRARENIEIDFDGVITFSPSWADEFLTPLLRRFGKRLILRPSDNPSVKATVEILERSSQKKFYRG